MLEGPTALTFVRGDAALAAKELAAFRRENGLLVFKGGTMNGDALSADDVEAISRLPARDILYGQLVGVVASPVTGLVRGLAGLISGVARQLQQIQEQGLVGGGGEATGGDAAEPPEPAAEAPGDPVSEAAAAEEESADGDAAAAESATEK
jgi:large subunit ribosomal protein L10